MTDGVEDGDPGVTLEDPMSDLLARIEDQIVEQLPAAWRKFAQQSQGSWHGLTAPLWRIAKDGGRWTIKAGDKNFGRFPTKQQATWALTLMQQQARGEPVSAEIARAYYRDVYNRQRGDTMTKARSATLAAQMLGLSPDEVGADPAHGLPLENWEATLASLEDDTDEHVQRLARDGTTYLQPHAQAVWERRVGERVARLDALPLWEVSDLYQLYLTGGSKFAPAVPIPAMSMLSWQEQEAAGRAREYRKQLAALGMEDGVATRHALQQIAERYGDGTRLADAARDAHHKARATNRPKTEREQLIDAHRALNAEVEQAMKAARNAHNVDQYVTLQRVWNEDLVDERALTSPYRETFWFREMLPKARAAFARATRPDDT